MPVTMQGSPLSQKLREGMIFDPVRGGWVSNTVVRPGQARMLPSNYDKGASPPGGKGIPPKHIENVHEGPWKLDMKQEQELGLAPPDWSTSSQMNDPRPNGRAMFDARFYGNAMGRAAGGYSMLWDPVGVAQNEGKVAAAENMDSNFFATDMADETAAAEASAEKNKYGNNTNFTSDDNHDLALAQMSKLQRRQMDADGDGQLSAAELAKHGF